MQVCETPQLYADKVLPFIQAIPAARIAWVYNILEKKVRKRQTWHLVILQTAIVIRLIMDN